MKKRLYLIIILFIFVSCEKLASIVGLGESDSNKTETSIADTTKILFIGNSLTYYNEMPEMVKNLAEYGEKNVFIEQAVIAGRPLRQLVNYSTITNKINSRKWDYVVLQSDDITAFPDMYNIEINTIKKFKEIIFSNNETTHIIYKMLWGLRNGVRIMELNGQLVYYSYQTYMDKIYEGTLYVADKTGVIISPVGLAWNKIRESNPGIELFDRDNAHPSYKGSYLTAAVHYSTIFGESSENIQYCGDLSEEEARVMRTIASSTVLDSTALWNLE